MKHTIIPTRMTFFRPIRSDNFPEKGLDSPADIVNNEIISPF
jgi:hypothetical protein